MRITIYILTFLLFVSCKTTQTKSELPIKNTITEYYEGGEIKGVGTIDDFHKEFNNYRIEFGKNFTETAI